MNKKYIVTDEYLSQRGLNLNDYAIDGTMINAIINLGLDLLVTRICYLNDSIKGEKDIENALGNDEQKINTFFKAQYRVIYNLISKMKQAQLIHSLTTLLPTSLKWLKSMVGKKVFTLSKINRGLKYVFQNTYTL